MRYDDVSLFWLCFTLLNAPSHQELEDVCNPVINRPKPTVEEAPEVNDQNSGAHNGPAAKQGAEGKGDAKGNQQTKPGTKEMEVD